MQSIILGGIPNEKQFGFTYNTPPNGTSGYQSFSGPGYYTKNPANNDGQQNQTPIGIKDLPPGAVVGTGAGQYTYHPSSAI
ncbi:outer membrane protein HopI [Helicobacter cetorum MIT 99-5656]|uniref:Outer membrane protein HopI n=1 Tax=Helicobacter cetorum (strain ATCC BAA-540 / CCUG 52418 / MIT 99-5656) TaxID=1163745 RepID=I0EUD6_HELCM|nr:outer membrane protein HopI [Helicobacter cetorum MIT 99-5656]